MSLYFIKLRVYKVTNSVADLYLKKRKKKQKTTTQKNNTSLLSYICCLGAKNYDRTTIGTPYSSIIITFDAFDFIF